MKTLDLHRLWEITQIMNAESERLEEENHVFVYIETQYSFELFLNYYSFKIDLEDNTICYYNDDHVPYEDFTTNEFNYFPIEVLNYSDDDARQYVNDLAIKKEIEQLRYKKDRISVLKGQIEINKKEIKRLENETKSDRFT